MRKYSGNEPATEILNKKITARNVKDKIAVRPKRGLHIDKKGYTASIVFSCQLNESEVHNVFIRLSQSEVFRLARLFKEQKSDEEFLTAIMKEE